MAGFFFATFFIYGFKLPFNSRLGLSILKIFVGFFGQIRYNEMADVSQAMAIVIMIFFGLICFLVILNLFIAIVMSNYLIIRRYGQLRTEAKARISSEEGMSILRKMLNLITCQPPKAKQDEQDEDDDEEMHIRKVDVLEKKDKESETVTMSTWAIFRMNLNALCNFTSDTTEKLKFKQNELMEIIKREDLAKRVEDKREQEEDVIYKIKEGIIYIIFLVLLITLLMLHIRVDSLYNANNSMVIAFLSNYKDNSLHSTDEFKTMIPAIFDNYASKINDELATNVNVFSNPFIVATLRLNVKQTRTNAKFSDNINFIFDNHYKSVESKSDIIPYKYYPKGSKVTYKKEGGVLLHLPYDYRNDDGAIQAITNSINVDLKQVAIEIYSFMRNSETFVWTEIVFKLLPSGLLRMDINNIAFLGDQYSTKAKKARILLEVIICLFILYFTYNELALFGQIFMKVRAQSIAQLPKSGPEESRWSRVLIFLYINPKKSKQYEACDYFLTFCFGLFKLVYYFFKHFILSIVHYIFYGLFHLINIATVIFYYFLIVNWIRIIVKKLSIDYYTSSGNNLLTGEQALVAIEKLSEVRELGQLYNLYIILSAVCLLLVFIQIINYFTFSVNMNVLLTVISFEKFNLFSFVFMYMLLLFGFSISGYILFGLKSTAYRNIGYAFVNSFKMAAGGFNYNDIHDADYIMAPIFFVIFNLFFALALLSMLTAIVGIGYEESVRVFELESKNEKRRGTLELIEAELQRKFEEIEAGKMSFKDVLNKKEYEEMIIRNLPLIYRIFAKFVSMNFMLPNYDNKEQRMTKRIDTNKVDNLMNDRNEEEEIALSAGSQKDSEDKVSPFIKNFLYRDANSRKIETIDDVLINEQVLSQNEKNRVALWMSTLEKVLDQKSDHELRLFDLIKKSSQKEAMIEFYPKKTIDEMDQSWKDFVYENRLSEKQKRMWSNASLDKKYQYWCAMDVLHSEYFDTNEKIDREEAEAFIEKLKNESKPLENTDKGRDEPVEETTKKEDIKKEEEKKENAGQEEKVDNADGVKNGEDKPNGLKDENKPEDKKEEETKVIIEENKSNSLDESLNSERNPSAIIVGVVLAPKASNVTAKGMYTSPEYSSSYSKTISELHWIYWKELGIAEKIQMWLFHFDEKQRAKLWTHMKFCIEPVESYINTNLVEMKKLLRVNYTLQDVWLCFANEFPSKDNQTESRTGYDSCEVLKHKISIITALLYDKKSKVLTTLRTKYQSQLCVYQEKLRDEKMKHLANVTEQTLTEKTQSSSLCLSCCLGSKQKKKEAVEFEHMPITQLREMLIKSAEKLYETSQGKVLERSSDLARGRENVLLEAAVAR